MRICITATLLTMSFLPGAEAGTILSTLPPIGQRYYVITSADGSIPAEIIEDPQADSPAVVLRDPLPPASDAQMASTVRIEQRENRILKAPESVLRFAELQINGRVTQPRVTFDSRIIDENRADAEIERDFFDKIFSILEDRDF